jgi:cysteine desulfurase family protein (TIGR01976 family)
MDIARIRAQFPALEAPTVFFDNAAGTQVPRRVVDRMVDYLRSSNANLGGVFPTSVRSDALFVEARRAIADLLGATDPDEVAFGANMTTLTQAFARAFGRTLGEGDEIVTTRLEHDANVAPWLALEAERGVRVRFADLHTEDATLDVESLRDQLSDRTRLVAVGLASNAFGTINPVARIAALAREAGALSFVDAVHYAPHGPIDVGALGCDVLLCSVYKFFGPHVGVLWGRRDVLERIPAYHLRTVEDRIPDKFETGTLNHEGIAGTLGAVEYLESLGAGASRRERLTNALETIQGRERRLAEELLDVFESHAHVRVHGITDRARLAERVPTFAITAAGIDPRTVASLCAEAGINVWSGNYYALEPMTRMGLEATGGAVRVSLVHYNTPAEIARLDALLGQLQSEKSVVTPA